MGSEMCIRDSSWHLLRKRDFLLMHKPSACGHELPQAQGIARSTQVTVSAPQNRASLSVTETRRLQDTKSAWPARIWNESFVSFFHFIYCSAWSRTIGQRKNEGADSSGCRAAHKIDRISACWCFMLRVASAACCSCMPRLLLLLLQVCPAAVRLWPSCK